MANLVALKRIPLKDDPTVNESMIQEFIFNHTEALGLGELMPILREKKQPPEVVWIFY